MSDEQISVTSNTEDGAATFRALSSRAKLLLLIFGASCFGIMLVATWLVWGSTRGLSDQPLAGGSFENLSDFRRSMLERDERDVRKDESVSFRSIIAPHDSDFIIYTLRPELNVKFQGVPVTTNSFGMRDEEMPLQKPEGTYRIALLGDSFAFGWGVEQDKIFAKVLEAELGKLSKGTRRFEILNFGVPGYSTFQEVALFEERGLQFSPDAVLVYFVENDFGLPFYIKNFETPGQVVSNREFVRMKKKADDTPDAERHQRLLKNLDANRALRSLAILGDEKKIKTFIVVNPGRNWEKDERKLWVMKRRENLQLLRIAAPMKSIFEQRGLTDKDLRLPDDPHPNAIKHGVIGEALAAELYPKLGL